MEKLNLKNVTELLGEGEPKRTDYDDRVTTFQLENGIELYYMPLCNGTPHDLTELSNDNLGIECKDVEHLKRLINLSFE